MSSADQSKYNKHNISESSSVLEEIYVTHKWKIENFSVHSELSSVGESLSSPYFGSADGQYKFFLRLFPAGKDDECRGNVSLYLQIKDCPGLKVKFRVLFYVDATDGPKPCTLNRNIVSINKGGIVTASRFFSVETLKAQSRRMVPDDCLHVGCDLTIYGDTVCKMKKSARPDIPLCSLSADLGRIYAEQLHPDLTLHVGHRTFNVHKAIMSARSPVFRAMFQHEGMVEASKGLVRIDDIVPEAMDALLQFMYTDDAPQVSTMADKILPAADKYGIDRLRAQCETLLCQGLCVQNVCSRLKLADMYRAEHLKFTALEFIRANSTEVLEWEGWAELEDSCPKLANDVLKKIIMWSANSRVFQLPTGIRSGSSIGPSPQTVSESLMAAVAAGSGRGGGTVGVLGVGGGCSTSGGVGASGSASGGVGISGGGGGLEPPNKRPRL